MIKDFTTGETEFVQIKVSAPDGRFPTETIKGGIDLRTALFEAKKYDKQMIIEIFDSQD